MLTEDIKNETSGREYVQKGLHSLIDEDVPLEYQLFTLSFNKPGAISYFVDNLPVQDVGIIHGQTGYHEFYKTLCQFYMKTGLDPIDIIAFKSWLAYETEIVEAMGGMAGVSAFIDELNSLELSEPEAVAKILRHRAQKRRQLDALQDLQQVISKKDYKPEVDNQKVTFLTEQIRRLEQDIGFDPLSGVYTGSDIAKSVDSLWETLDFLPTQFPSLNRALAYTDNGGFLRGAVYAIVASSAGGKSTLAKNLMNYWCDQGHSVLFVNYEEPKTLWEKSLLCQVTGRNVYKEISTAERIELTDKFVQKLNEWGDKFMVRHDPDTPYFDDLEHWLRDILGHNTNVPEVIIIDTIQSLFAKGTGGGARWGQFEEMMVRLEKLAKDMNAIIIITAQQNTNAMKEKREVIQQSDIGGSIAIVQKCTAAIVMTKATTVNGDIIQLQIPKNRITGTVFSNNNPSMIYYDDSKTLEECKPPTEEDYVDDSLYNENFYN